MFIFVEKIARFKKGNLNTDYAFNGSHRRLFDLLKSCDGYHPRQHIGYRRNGERRDTIPYFEKFIDGHNPITLSKAKLIYHRINEVGLYYIEIIKNIKQGKYDSEFERGAIINLTPKEFASGYYNTLREILEARKLMYELVIKELRED